MRPRAGTVVAWHIRALSARKVVTVAIQGLDAVIKNLNREIVAIEGRSLKGLILAAALIRRDMDQTPPLIPVDTGNMRASWFVTPGQGLKGPYVSCGFSANYSVFVHENLKAVFQRPGAGAKFFQASINRNKKNILGVIREEARIR